MAKHTQTIFWLLLTNCLSVFDHFVGFTLKGFNKGDSCSHRRKTSPNVFGQLNIIAYIEWLRKVQNWLYCTRDLDVVIVDKRKQHWVSDA